VVRVLVVEDEPKLASILRRGLRTAGHAADVATRGEDALWMAGSTAYGAIVLDIVLPGIDGHETCRRLRADGVQTPVLMLTARGAVDDRVRGLDAGADDYLVKPFAFDELLARLRALTRRTDVVRAPVLHADGLTIDPAAHTVHRDGIEIVLSQREFALLEALARQPGVALSRFALLETVWDEAYEHRSNVIDVYIGYLRDKVDRPFGAASIETVRGVGYRLRG
jgi:two-component system OmpR family response regulator